MRRSIAISILALCFITALAPRAHAMGDLYSSATCTDGVTINVGWEYYEYYPTDCPQWVGYDVMRRSLSECGSWTRVNAQPYPRVPGPLQHSDAPPALNVMYEYRIVFVDAERNPVSCAGMCGFCSMNSRACAPALSAPLTMGTLQDWGWALYVSPCAESCYPGMYFEGPMVEQLRPYVATGQPIRFWGTEFCGTVEGCGFQVSHYEPAACGVTAAQRTSWGRVKTIYR